MSAMSEHQGDAQVMMLEALKLSDLSNENAEDLYKRLQLKARDYSYEHEVFLWQFAPNNSNERVRATALFFEAGKRFMLECEFKPRSQACEAAIRCFHWALWSARLSKGKKFRKFESDAAHWIAYYYLTISEVSTSEDQKKELDELAARYFELSGHIELTHGQPKDAVDCYMSASFRYGIAERYEQSARAAAKEAEIAESMGDSKRANQAYAIEANALLKATQREIDKEHADFLHSQRIQALFKSGQLLARIDDPTERQRAAYTLLNAGTEALKEPEWGERGIIPDSLTQAKTLFESFGEFNKADECHYLLAQYRGRQYTTGKIGCLHPFYLFSRILDVVWGYGTRPIRLFPVSAIVVLVFAIIYLICGDVNWANVLMPQETPILHRTLSCLTLSGTSIVPVQIIDRSAKLDLLPLINVGWVSLKIVWIESLLGCAICYMVIFSISRWFKRRFIPT